MTWFMIIRHILVLKKNIRKFTLQQCNETVNKCRLFKNKLFIEEINKVDRCVVNKESTFLT